MLLFSLTPCALTTTRHATSREGWKIAAACFPLMFYLFCFNVMRLRIIFFLPSLEATAAEETTFQLYV